MGLTETLLFYLLIGAGITLAAMASAENRSPFAASYRGVTILLFWPLYLPLLLSPPSTVTDPPSNEADDELIARIRLVESELDAALASLAGWSEETLDHERSRINELQLAWRAQASRIHDMDRLLAVVRADDESLDSSNERASHSEEARRENFIRLQAVRDRAHEDLTTTLARVRELVSLIHLANYTGEPTSRAEDLVAQIAASIEGLSEVSSWESAASA